MSVLDRIKTQTGLDRNQALEKGKYVVKQTRQIKSIDEDNHVVRVTINDRSVDRDGEVILPKSFEEMLGYYLESGVVLFAHNHHQPPIAKMVDHRIDENEFVAFDQFAVDEYEFALTCWNLCKGGYMKAASVGFIPLAWEDPSEEDKLPNQTGVTYTKCELLEHSILPIGSNRNALIKIYSETKDHWDPVVVKMVEKFIDQKVDKKCDHIDTYDLDGNLIDPCPLCIIETRQSSDLKTKESDPKKEDENIIYIPKSRQETFEFVDKVAKDLGSELRFDPDEKPFPNEHACRLKNPDQFKTCRRSTRESEGKEYSVIFCQRKDNTDKWEEQAYRYNKNVWTVEQAKDHCSDRNGTFEAASEETGGDKLDTKKVVSFQDLDLTDRNHKWDPDQAVERVRSWAGGENIDWDQYQKAFVWFDPEDPENFGSYKLPIGDIIEDDLKVVPKAIFSVAVVLQNGTDISEDEIELAKSHIEKYYEKINLEAPWSREEESVALSLLKSKDYERLITETLDRINGKIFETLDQLLEKDPKDDEIEEETKEVELTTEDEIEGYDFSSLTKIVERINSRLG